MLNEVSINCFLSVARHLSFSKAAEEVFMSRQAVSKKILSLEKRLGAKLFDRTTNVIALTVAGKLYLDFFRRAVQDFETLSETIVKVSASTVTLRIGYELGFVIDERLIQIIGEYKRRSADADFKIKRYDPLVIESKLMSGQLDLAFTTIPMQGDIYKDFSRIILDYADYALVTSTNHPSVNDRASLADFDGKQAIYWDNDPNDEICRKRFDAAWSNIGITLIPSIQCSSLSSAYTELLLGNAVLVCNTKNEICALPGMITFPLAKRDVFGCVWRCKAPAAINEFAETFRKYEIDAGQ